MFHSLPSIHFQEMYCHQVSSKYSTGRLASRKNRGNNQSLMRSQPYINRALCFVLACIFTPVLSAASPAFTNDVMPVLERLGCNASACHGKAEGQNGFKLSVFGHDPEGDFLALTKESRGRRVSPAAPADSLLLRKITGEVGHGGGVRTAKGSRAYRVLHDWIAGGMPFESTDRPALVKVRLEPERSVVKFGQRLPLKVMAEYADGSKRDVTWLSVFHSNDVGMAQVTESGEVNIGDVVGQTSVMARFHGKVAVFQAVIPRPGAAVAYPKLPVQNFIDGHVDNHLKRLNIAPSHVADDATYLRRVYLDIIGKLPTPPEAEAFLKSGAKDKRAKLVDTLLARPEFADYWALQWSDLLRVDRLKLGHANAHQYYKWIRASFARNKPMDSLARELLTAEGPLTEQPAGFFYRAANGTGDMASMVSQVFLGVRITCAECHQHPYDRWTQQDYHAMRGFFQQVSTKNSAGGLALLAEGNPVIKHPRTGKVIQPYPLGSEMPETAPEGDRRRLLAKWMTQPDNPYFARNIANRLWAHFLGRGIVMPVDDLRETNPPSNPELLDALASHLAKNKFDLKAMIRTITASRTYQLSPTPNATNVNDEQNFSRALFRRLPAEVLMDAVCDVTGVDEKFDGVPRGYRAVQLWDSQVQHYFLKLFGRPARATVCECERVTGATIGQALHLMNSPNLEAKLAHEAGRVKRLTLKHEDDADIVRELYLSTFSRPPSRDEMDTALQYLGTRRFQRRKAVEDLTWSLMNSLEFIFNH